MLFYGSIIKEVRSIALFQLHANFTFQFLMSELTVTAFQGCPVLVRALNRRVLFQIPTLQLLETNGL